MSGDYNAPGRSWAFRWTLAIALGFALALLPVDGEIVRGVARFRESLGGDVRRELELLQQFGGVTSLVLISATIWLLDPTRRRSLIHLLVTMGILFAVVNAMKILIGRPRPRFEEPLVFLGPFRTFDLGPPVGARHSWEIGSGILADLWSMPSSHTAFAAGLAVFLCVMYPRVRPLAWFMLGVVAVSRLIFGAHYASDIVVGGTLGACVSTLAFRFMRTSEVGRRQQPGGC
ncbi:MAG: phosphatase PAP2 family protein [Phycisphaeraceae bacterium]|nr:phosphatase PAP2 family protein [Phycisphaeraceae bacterium]